MRQGQGLCEHPSRGFRKEVDQRLNYLYILTKKSGEKYSVNRAVSFFHNPVFSQLPVFRFVYSQQGLERNNATTAAPVIIQIAIARILRLALRHCLCSRRSSYSDLPWAAPPLATATGREKQELDRGVAEFGYFSPLERDGLGGVFTPF